MGVGVGKNSIMEKNAKRKNTNGVQSPATMNITLLFTRTVIDLFITYSYLVWMFSFCFVMVSVLMAGGGGEFPDQLE